LTSTGAYFGSHTGLHSYTVGQKFRKSGLPMGGPRWFVAAKDRANNALVVVPGACALDSSCAFKGSCLIC
jgi:tRNA U34 2-thiouridine synthase MnmA/TrmU